MATQAEAVLEAGFAHLQRAESDVINRIDVEAAVLESSVRAWNQPKAVMVADAFASGKEGHLPRHLVGDPQTQRIHVERFRFVVIMREHEQVSELIGTDVAFQLLPQVTVDTGL